MPGPWLLLLLLLPPARDQVPPPAAGQSPAPSAALAVRRERAAALLRTGPAGWAVLLEEAASGPAAGRRAALEALASFEACLDPGLEAGPALRFHPPPGTVAVAVAALASDDASLREAATETLVACGEDARVALAAVVQGRAGAARGIPAARARDALFEIGRAAVERDFLSIWDDADGSYSGMFDPLRVHGQTAARVLTAIALDRRTAGPEELDFGPYRWRVPPPPLRDRLELRLRAIDALSDSGDVAARERLRAALRARPAGDLLHDTDPIPAGLDDAMRSAIADLGDPAPLRGMLEASRGTHGEPEDTPSYEARRQAHALIRLGRLQPAGELRTSDFDRAERLYAVAMEGRRDGVDSYNRACLLAQRAGPGDPDRALDFLEMPGVLDAIGSDWLVRDGDLATLRGHPRFQALARRLRERERRLDAILEGR